MSGDFFDHFSGAIAGDEVAAGVSGVGRELGFDQAGGFENFGEVEARERAQAAEGVGDGDALGGFTVVFGADHFAERHAKFGFDPLLGGGEGAVFVLELLNERRGEVGFGADGFGFELLEGALEGFVIAACAGGHAVGPEVAGFAKLLGAVDALD